MSPGEAYGGINLDTFLKKCRALDPNLMVVLDRHEETPGFWFSYRGYYEDLALEYGTDPERYPSRTVRQLWCRSIGAIGSRISGYKGGQYFFQRTCGLWVSPYGVASGEVITDIVADGPNALIVTELVDD